LLTAAARHGVRMPLAENDLLACWLLDTAGVSSASAVRTVCLIDAGGSASGVPWASCADRVVVVWADGDGHRAADIAAEQLSITPGTNMIGEPRDLVAVDTSALDGVALADGVLAQLRTKSALVRSIQVCAALDRALDMAVEHARAREQFGRPLAKFQAVQQLISDTAAEAALARSATEAALAAAVTAEWAGDHVEFLVAAARSCAGHAASVVVRNAHQVLGAIGTTREHLLHEHTRAALAWRSEYGSVHYWDERVTDMALQSGDAGLWELICP
ncbi:MAG: acyl-CoA dehydrogenase family protein, partial [Actinomycetota bacterium]|nr:acyl-CoA dehydrogenase family protein [Actinomycetota bacterium]